MEASLHTDWLQIEPNQRWSTHELVWLADDRLVAMDEALPAALLLKCLETNDIL
jgi:hypothetical protein